LASPVFLGARCCDSRFDRYIVAGCVNHKSISSRDDTDSFNLLLSIRYRSGDPLCASFSSPDATSIFQKKSPEYLYISHEETRCSRVKIDFYDTFLSVRATSWLLYIMTTRDYLKIISLSLHSCINKSELNKYNSYNKIFVLYQCI